MPSFDSDEVEKQFVVRLLDKDRVQTIAEDQLPAISEQIKSELLANLRWGQDEAQVFLGEMRAFKNLTVNGWK